jgi:imidazolonepropionase
MNMMLVTNISQLVTVAGSPRARRGAQLGEESVFRDAVVLIIEEKILALGPRKKITAMPEAKNAEIVDAGGCAVLPGFCDSHTHPVFAGSRLDEYELKIKGASYEQIAASGGGILNTAKAVREASETELCETALRHAAMFLAHGTTYIEAKSGYGLDPDSEIKILRAIARAASRTPLEMAPTFLGAHQVPAEYKDNREAYVRLLCDRMIPMVADEGLAEFCDVFCDRTAFSISETRRILEAGRRRGLKPRVHADQMSLFGAAMLAVEVGALSADHLECIGKKEIAALAASQTIATLLPGSVFHLGRDRYAPARALIDAGAAVSLATDFNPGSSPSVNMQMILSLACDTMRMTPAEAVAAATFNGACAIGREKTVGSLEPGKQADLMIATVADYRMIPYHFGMNHCRIVIKKGRIV